MEDKDYIAVVQCHLVKQRYSGYQCERAFHDRTGGFIDYPADKAYRTLYLTCGGCCGRPLQRKLINLARKIKAREGIEKDRIVVQLSSCITSNHTHLLLTAEEPRGISALMQKLEGEFAEYYNLRKRRSGAFWGGRFHCTMVDGNEYLWSCIADCWKVTRSLCSEKPMTDSWFNYHNGDRAPSASPKMSLSSVAPCYYSLLCTERGGR